MNCLTRATGVSLQTGHGYRAELYIDDRCRRSAAFAIRQMPPLEGRLQIPHILHHLAPRAASSSASISRRSSRFQQFLSSARSSSMCCSSVIVVSLTLVKDDAGGREDRAGSRIVKRPPEAASGGTDFLTRPFRATAENWRGRDVLEAARCSRQIWRSEQTVFGLV
jgi:hypothetical protein